MLNWAITFFLIAIIAAFLGFGGVAGTAAGVGSLLLKVFGVSSPSLVKKLVLLTRLPINSKSDARDLRSWPMKTLVK